MMGWSPQCFIPCFVVIDLSVPENVFEGVFTIYGRGGHLGHVTSIMSSDFHFLVPESFHKKLVQIGTVVSEKILHIFNRCLLILTYRSLAKSTVFTFLIEKPMLPNLTLPLNRSRSLQGHHLNKL